MVSRAGRSPKESSEPLTLEQYLNSEHWALPIGDRTRIVGNWCKYCRSDDLFVEVRLEVDDPSGCLSGARIKTTAHRIYVLCCAACGRFSGDGRGSAVS